jgi:hypothetical protein
MSGLDLTPSSRFSWRDLLRPGPILAILGIVVLAVTVTLYSWGHRAVDPLANPEMLANNGTDLKYMLWMMGGVGLLLSGALLSFLDFQKR